MVMVGELGLVGLGWLLERFVPWSMMVSLGLWWGRNGVVFRPRRLLFLFFWGVAEDIVDLGQLGIRSGLVISLMMIAWLVARYYQSRLWWWYVLGVVGEFALMVIKGGGWSIWPVVCQLVFLGLLNWWSVRSGRQGAIYVKT